MNPSPGRGFVGLFISFIFFYHFIQNYAVYRKQSDFICVFLSFQSLNPAKAIAEMKKLVAGVQKKDVPEMKN